ncbi:TPA: hypothetical protein N0G49_000402 [Pseudomonas aeruginosa]|nr:hypothetical protein [Pseudomonas aeruginosa]
MSSTQHQLIEQCATRLRGIVEALDNIHDNTPLRWSTDLDDVHSSAESLLAMIKDQAPARSEASFEEWLANELEGEDGQPVPAAVCDIALARRAFNHWPKLEQPAKVGSVRFSAGVSSRLVVEAAQRLYEFESTPEQEAERIERLQAFREQLDPLNLAPHAEAFNEAPDEAIRPEQAEAERPEVVAFRYHCTNAEGEPLPGWFYSDDAGTLGLREPLMTVAQHERIVGALRAKAVQLREALEWRKENQAGQRELLRSVTAERDAALARVAELERQEPVALANRGLHAFWVKWTEAAAGLYGPGIKLYAAPVAQAQHSVPEEFSFEYRHPNGESHTVTVSRDQVINEMPDFLFEALCSKFCNCEPVGETNVVECCCDEYAEEFKLLAAAPGKEVPQAWLDVQAERRRQVEVEGYHGFRDNHYISYELSKAARAYIEVSWHALSGGLPCKKPESWPWMAGFKWSDGRTMLVKACALALAEIERLDRATATQGGPRDA